MPMDELFARLDQSKFRRQFKLNAKDAAYFQSKGLALVLDHAREFFRERLQPAYPANDGAQTPMRGHPVFVAQHATGTCCRGCILKWHKIEKDRTLTDDELARLIEVIAEWLTRQTFTEPSASAASLKEPERGGQLSFF